MAKKDLFIHHIQQIKVGDLTNIPTALFYRPDVDPLIGYEALDATEDVLEVNQDFKVDLGRHDLNTTGRRLNPRFPTASGEQKSAYVMTQDFFTEILRQTSRWLSEQQVEQAAHILIAEPLAMHAESDSRWLENYRRNVRELLRNRTSQDYPNIRFEEVSFLPEPFAVFQYYRYGINHQLLSTNKNQALILDFGGGTFDVCVIETTKGGDISESGRNSKPYGASSEPVGGFYINRKLAEHLYRQYLLTPARRDQFKRGLQVYESWRRNGEELTTLREDLQTFVLNLHRTSFELENPKVALCKQIRDWSLEAPLTAQTKVRLPADPFIKNSPPRSVALSATEMRQVFLDQVWEKRLKPTVRLCLNRAAEDLRGQPLSLVLLSGGSANIGWLEAALFQDFSTDLAEAQVLRLPDFQEVVAKGLAAECARRFYTPEGDFGAVVYNRLCLMLDINPTDESSDCRPRRFQPITLSLPNTDQPGVLLQSASTVQNFIDQPMRWKVRQIGTQPKRLNYYFLRSSLDPEDTDNRLNFEEISALAPRNCRFDQELKLELVVRDDGTALPRFIYHAGRTEQETVSTDGKPFALDVTVGATSASAKAYIGFDFGTSNSSVSFVESRGVTEYKRRLGESSWKELHELAYELPYPIAHALREYLSETSNRERRETTGRQTAEAMLAMLTYSAIADHRWQRQERQARDKSKVFGQLTQRSAGPLWATLRQMFDSQGFAKRATFTSPVAELFTGELYQTLNVFINAIAQIKHDKAQVGSVDFNRPLHAVANICHRVFRVANFGYFENVQRLPFSQQPKFKGQFRVTHDQPPFIRACEVMIGGQAPPVITPYLLIAKQTVALPLFPMVLWWQDGKNPSYDHGDCHLFDRIEPDASRCSYKTVSRSAQLEVTLAHPELADLLPLLGAERTNDGPIEIIHTQVLDCNDEDVSR